MGQPQNVDQPQNGGAPFNIQNGRYNVADPTGMSHRGYINPQTGLPYATSQPYLSNILATLEYEVNLHGGPTLSLQNTKWGNVEWRFLSEYMRYHYPNRPEHQWWNSKVVRDAMRKAP